MDPAKKSSYWKFVVGFLGIIFTVAFAYVGWAIYDSNAFMRRLDTAVDAMRRAEAESLARATADKVGGKTPQETLALYIDAVEKGDYDLASKYFVLDKQESERKSLEVLGEDKKKFDFLVSTLKKVVISKTGEYSSDRRYFSFYDPVAIDLFLYPSGNWKIYEI